MNVLGTNLKLCGSNPLTDYNRKGYMYDKSSHLVCAIVTKEFLDIS
jgi:uncharacterized protein (DUF2237 family)